MPCLTSEIPKTTYDQFKNWTKKWGEKLLLVSLLLMKKNIQMNNTEVKLAEDV